jgi:lysophospholipase L1-like esterase
VGTSKLSGCESPQISLKIFCKNESYLIYRVLNLFTKTLKMKGYFFLFYCILHYSCATPNPKQKQTADTKETTSISYLALGDSYTIGESVPSNQRWPILLSKALRAEGHDIQNPIIIAQTGWRTDNLLKAMKAELSTTEKYDLVSILIGVNNQFQGASIEKYEQDLRTLFDQAIEKCSKGKEGVFVLSIPDYGATPYGASRAESIGKAIDQWNAVCKKVTLEYQLAWYDITPISRTATENKSLIAEDGLHPSGKMYQLWVDQITTKVLELLK